MVSPSDPSLLSSKDPFPNKVTITFGGQDMEDLLRGHHQHPVPQDFLLALAGLYRFTFGGKTTMVLKSESALQKSVETQRGGVAWLPHRPVLPSGPPEAGWQHSAQSA